MVKLLHLCAYPFYTSPIRPCWLALSLLVLLPSPLLAAPPRAELLPGRDPEAWVLIIEADGDHQSNELIITPLLRQFAVGSVSTSRVTTQISRLTRWQIPLYRVAADADTVPSLTLGQQQTPALPLPESMPERSDSAAIAAATQAPTAARPPVELQAKVLHQGPLYPGQPFIYQLNLWLPANMEAPNLSEPMSNDFTIRRLGNDQWQSPANPALPGRLTRSWLLQAKEPGLWPLESPRFQGRLAQDDGQSDPLSARASTLFVKVDKAPVQPVASRLTLTQQLSPARGAKAGEPVIRTLTLVLEGGDGHRLTLPRLDPLPADLQVRPDGEQQQERFLAKGELYFERQWRQALTASKPGDYLLPAIELPWFNTRSGLIEQARLPATRLHIAPAPAAASTAAQSSNESLCWVLWALLLRSLWRHWPRWRAFYRLQYSLHGAEPDLVRQALLAWSQLRWDKPYQGLGALPCHRSPRTGPLLDALDRACFASPPVQPDRRSLARELCAHESFAIATGLRLLAGVRGQRPASS